MATASTGLRLEIFEEMPRSSAQFQRRLRRDRFDVCASPNTIGAKDSFIGSRHTKQIVITKADRVPVVQPEQ